MTEGGDAAPGVEDGRYLYCVVRTAEADREGEEQTEEERGVGTPTFETTGIEEASVSLVAAGGVGAVVHRRGVVYASERSSEVTEWLLAHQSVVDEAGEAFGTPLPFRFDTVVEGGDEAVRTWLREEGETLRSALDSLAGHWEYRIELTTDATDEAALREADERLRELAARRENAGDGASFLREKQYERRLAELRRSRHAERVTDLRETLDDLAREVHETEGGGAAASASDDREDAVSTSLALLAREDRESALGDALDEVAAAPGVEVRFTGPWPPYTFAPTLGGEDGAA